MRALLLLACAASAASFAPATLSPVRPMRAGTSAKFAVPTIARCSPPLLKEEDAALVDRAVAAAVYLLPAIDGFAYGSYVYANIPPVGAIAYLFLPLVNTFNSLPFVGLILFVGLSFFTRNQGLSRFVRFNIQQALLLDIVLIIPSFFGDIGRVFPAELQAMGTNFVFYLMVLVVGYSWFNVAQGKTPNAVPIISEAADMQIGPF
mgnify:CR=1 FL=1